MPGGVVMFNLYRPGPLPQFIPDVSPVFWLGESTEAVTERKAHFAWLRENPAAYQRFIDRTSGLGPAPTRYFAPWNPVDSK